MAAYVLRRVLLAVPTMLLVTIGVFALLRMVPGDITVTLLGDDHSPEAAKELRRELNLDGPIPLQYVRWMGDLAVADLGNSWLDRREISYLLRTRIPVTLQLSLMTLTLSLLIGVPLGVYVALRQDSPMDYLLRSAAVFGLAAPSFWIATIFLVYGSEWVGYSPPVFYRTPWEDLGTNVQMMAWPAIISSIPGAAVVMRMTRAMMLEVVREDYIRTAFAKGLPQATVIRRHAMRNAMIPVVTIFGISLAQVLSGSVISETVFGLPGMGRMMVQSVLGRDLPVVQAITLLLALAVVAVNIVIDLSYAWIDPRIQHR